MNKKAAVFIGIFIGVVALAVVLSRPVKDVKKVLLKDRMTGASAAAKAVDNGTADGVIKDYYSSGKLKSEGVFKNGRPAGTYKEYFENGQLKSESSYDNGVPEGWFRTYDEGGQLRTENLYKDGAEVKKAKTDGDSGG
jgi:antitoxin component YwqK of YwqJK toxin-antitoxin module